MAKISNREWIYKGEKKEAYRVTYTDSSGKRRHKQFEKRKDASDFAKTCEGKAVARHGNLTIKEAAERWLMACEKGLGDHVPVEAATLRQYRGHVDNHIVPMIGDRTLGEMAKEECGKFRDDLILRLSRRQSKKVFTSFKSILGQVEDDDSIPMNVAS